MVAFALREERVRELPCRLQGLVPMNEVNEQPIALKVRLKPVDHSDLPQSANYSHVGVVQGIAYLDFGFIELVLPMAIAKTAKDGQRFVKYARLEDRR